MFEVPWSIPWRWVPCLLSLLFNHEQRGPIHVNGQNFSNYDHLHSLPVVLVSDLQRVADNNFTTFKESSNEPDNDYGWSLLDLLGLLLISGFLNDFYRYELCYGASVWRSRVRLRKELSRKSWNLQRVYHYYGRWRRKHNEGFINPQKINAQVSYAFF